MRENSDTGAAKAASPRVAPEQRDALGDHCKTFEAAEGGRRAMRGLPILARLDGRAFHTFTRGLRRPFDAGFSECMRGTAAALVEEFHPLVAYTQSDEITLAWFVSSDGVSQYPFDGRFQKLCSVMAGHASVCFSRLVAGLLPAKSCATPVFDCRVWQVPTLKEALDVFVWREDDAVKNSITMLAQAHFSHKQLHGHDSGGKLVMLNTKGVLWQEEPTHFKRGLYLRRVTRERSLTDEEREAIPEPFRPPPEATFLRSAVEVIDLAPIRREPDALRILFDDAGVDALKAPSVALPEAIP